MGGPRCGVCVRCAAFAGRPMRKKGGKRKGKVGGAQHPPLWEVLSVGVAHQGLLELHTEWQRPLRAGEP
eukprot:5221099-Prymnesium_polylepis.2